MSFTNPGLEIWNPEKLDSYEVGAKASFRGAVSGYFNFAAFYNDLTNQQFFAGLLPTPQAAVSGVSGGATIVNAGSSRVFGIEVAASVRLFDSLRLTADYTYLDTKVKTVEAAATQGDGSPLGQLLVGTPFAMISPRVQVGSPFNDSPKHKLSATATYTLPLDKSIGDVSFGATWVYSSSYINDGAAPATVGNQFLGVTPGTNLLNLNFDWKSVVGSSFDLALFATNVTKERFNVASTGAWASAGVAEVTWNQPRFYGIWVRYNFEAT